MSDAFRSTWLTGRHHLAVRSGGAALALCASVLVVVTSPEFVSPAFADSAPYELYCPGTPVGDIALNDVVTTGTVSPQDPSAWLPVLCDQLSDHGDISRRSG